MPMVRDECEVCDKPATRGHGNLDRAEILLVTDFPGPRENQIGKGWTDFQSQAFMEEFDRALLPWQRVFTIYLYPHIAPPDKGKATEQVRQDHATNLFSNVVLYGANENINTLLIAGPRSTNALLNVTADTIFGLNMVGEPEAKLLTGYDIIVAMPSPGLLSSKGVGEAQLSLEKLRNYRND